MSRIPGTTKGPRPQLQCPYAAEHRLPNGGLIPRSFISVTGINLREDSTEAEWAAALHNATLTCILDHTWRPSDGPGYTPHTTADQT